MGVDILGYLNSMPGCRAIKVKGSEYMSSEPDIIACLQGRFLALEQKRPGERARPSQLSVLRKWRDVGAIAGVVRCTEDVNWILETHGWLPIEQRWGGICFPRYMLYTKGHGEKWIADMLADLLVNQPVNAKGKLLTEWSPYFPIVEELSSEQLPVICLLYQDEYERERWIAGLGFANYILREALIGAQFIDVEIET